MAMRYADIDQGNGGVAKSVIMRFEYDTNLLSDPKADAILGLKGPFPFQFPPRISSDSKSAKWKTIAAQSGSYDDIVMWQGADSRSLNIDATYIIDGAQWTAERISKIAHAAKAYLYLSLAGRLESPLDAPCVIIESLYGAVEQRSSWRMESASISYGDQIVGPFSTSPKYHPLMTKVSFTLKSWVKLSTDMSADKGDKDVVSDYKTADKGDKDVVSDYKNLEVDTSALWY